MRGAERLPGETEPGRPQDSLCFFEGLLLIDQDCLVVRLIRIMTERLEWNSRASEAAAPANRIGLMIPAECECQRQVRLGAPLVLTIES